MKHELMAGASYTAHGASFLWKPWLITLHAVSDMFLAGAYFLVPAAMLFLLRFRTPGQSRQLAYLAVGFAAWCGLMHVLSVITLWWPAYEIQGLAKFVGAAFAIITVAAVVPVAARSLSFPTLGDLKSVNQQLASEIASHQDTVAELEQARGSLERRVDERTEELSKAVEQVNFLMRELAHRSKNLLAVVQSMARQTLRHSDSPEQFEEKFMARLQGLGQAQDELVRNNWRGVELDRLVLSQLAPFTGGDRVAIEGPDVFVKPEASQHIGLALHELATNAVKHGALSVPEGRVQITWRIEDMPDAGRQFRMSWVERGVAVPGEPESRGFGFTVLERVVPVGLGGKASIRFDPEGLSWTLLAPETAVMDPASTSNAPEAAANSRPAMEFDDGPK